MNYAGSTQMNMGNGAVLQLAVPDALPTNTDLVAGTNRYYFGTPTLDLDGNNQQLASLQSASWSSTQYLIAANSSANAATLTIGGSTGTTYGFVGVIQDGNGTLNFVRSGSGVTILQGSSGVGTYSYTGVTSVLSGELELENATLSGGGQVSVSGGDFGGTGTLSGRLTVGNGALFEGQYEGSSIGSLTVKNSVSLAPSSTFIVQINQPTTGNTGYEGVDNDTLYLTGGSRSVFSPNGAALDLVLLYFPKTSGLDYQYIIVDASAGSLAPGQTFAGLAQGQIYTQGGFSYSVDYGQSQPGDIVLTVYSIPEPAAFLATLGLAHLLVRRTSVSRRKRT